MNKTDELSITLGAQALYKWSNDNVEIRAFKDGFFSGFCEAKREYVNTITNLTRQRDELLKSLKWSLSVVDYAPYEWSCEENVDAHNAAIALVADIEGT